MRRDERGQAVGGMAARRSICKEDPSNLAPLHSIGRLYTIARLTKLKVLDFKKVKQKVSSGFKGRNEGPKRLWFGL